MKKERKEAWMRILVAIVSGIILKVWGIVVGIVAILNWLIALFSAKRNKSLAEFCEPWNTETYKYISYLTGVSNKRPFPFSDIERTSKFER
ncbi:MAG: DUF4389 domain-containing protein [Nanoarchaeota archaeon]